MISWFRVQWGLPLTITLFPFKINFRADSEQMSILKTLENVNLKTTIPLFIKTIKLKSILKYTKNYETIIMPFPSHFLLLKILVFLKRALFEKQGKQLFLRNVLALLRSSGVFCS